MVSPIQLVQFFLPTFFLVVYPSVMIFCFMMRKKNKKFQVVFWILFVLWLCALVFGLGYLFYLTYTQVNLT